MSKFDCISIGAATVDVILKSDSFKVVKTPQFETGMAICEMYGSKTAIQDFFVGSGGGATNSACSLAHFGLKTSCISLIGNDTFSDLVLDDLNNFGVDVDNLIIKKGEKTAFSTILTAPDGGRTAMVYRGASENITVKDIQNQNFNADWIYLTNLGSNFSNFIEVLNFLKNKKLNLFWNPGANELKDANVSKLEQVDILSLNNEEAAILSGIDMENTKDLVKFLVKEIPTKTILLTLAEKGAFCIHEKKLYHVSSFKVKAESTLGAGDAFGSGFLYGQIRGLSIEESLEYAIKNSVSVIQKTGAKEGFVENINTLPKPKIKRL